MLPVKWNLFLFVDENACLVFQSDNVKDIGKQLNQDLANIWDWFVDNKLIIHFGDDKTKSILFTSKRKIKMVPKLDIIYKNIQIKQHSLVTYLDCILYGTLSGESMACKVIGKVNTRLKFLYHKKKFLTKKLHHLLCLNTTSFLLWRLSLVP